MKRWLWLKLYKFILHIYRWAKDRELQRLKTALPVAKTLDEIKEQENILPEHPKRPGWKLDEWLDWGDELW